MRNITLRIGIKIPYKKFEPLSIDAEITVEKEENETDEDLFERAHQVVHEVLDAEAALSYHKFIDIENSGGKLRWAEDTSKTNNTFIKQVTKGELDVS